MSSVSAVSGAGSARARLPLALPLDHMVAGMAGGVTSTLLLHPLDLVKIRFAASKGSAHSPASYSGIANAFKTIVSTEGARGLYRGVTPNMWSAGCSWGLTFLFYSSIKTWMQDGDSARDLGAMKHIMVAAEAGILTLAVTNPISVVRTRLCLQTTGEAALLPESKRFSGMLDALKKTYRHEGPRGLYKGFVPGIWGVSHGALQFMAYEEMKSLFNRRRGRSVDSRLSTLEYLQFAAFSKLFAACATYPYQVVRARLQDHRASYKGSMDVIRTTLRQEGPRGLYRGLTPHLLHVTPNICCVFLVYEMMTGGAEGR